MTRKQNARTSLAVPALALIAVGLCAAGVVLADGLPAAGGPVAWSDTDLFGDPAVAAATGDAGAVISPCTGGGEDPLIEDDGHFEAILSVLPTFYAVACIAPSHYPSFLTEISVLVEATQGQSYRLAVFTDSGTNGPDGSAVWVSGTSVPPDVEWVDVDVSGMAEFQAPITRGSWCIGFRELTYGVNIAFDTNAPRSNHTWIGQPGLGWVNASGFVQGDAAFRGNTQYCPDQCACYVDGQCRESGAVNPDNPCEICDPDVSAGQWAPNDGASCDDGQFCNGTDTCDGSACTDHAGSPCPNDGQFCNGTESCNEDTDQCEHSGSPCPDDGQFCNGEETCNEGTDHCGHAGNPCPLDDGLFCNGAETNACNESTDECGHEGNPCPMDDGLFCNGDETADCDDSTDQCGHEGNPCPIDDGLFCNGDETADCLESSDECGHAGDPCDEAQQCLEDSDSCEDIVDDDTGDDDTTDDDTTDDDTTDDDSWHDDDADDDVDDDTGDDTGDDTADDDLDDDSIDDGLTGADAGPDFSAGGSGCCGC